MADDTPQADPNSTSPPPAGPDLGAMADQLKTRALDSVRRALQGVSQALSQDDWDRLTKATADLAQLQLRALTMPGEREHVEQETRFVLSQLASIQAGAALNIERQVQAGLTTAILSFVPIVGDTLSALSSKAFQLAGSRLGP